MTKQNNNRKRLLVDGSVQGALMRRVVLHWGLFLVLVFLFLSAWQLLVSGEPLNFSSEAILTVWRNCIPVLVSMIVLLPVFLRDTVRLSNRFSGPILRLKNEMKALADGKENPPVKFRDNDFWQELAAEFNRVAELVHDRQSSSTTESALKAADKAEECLAKASK